MILISAPVVGLTLAAGVFLTTRHSVSDQFLNSKVATDEKNEKIKSLIAASITPSIQQNTRPSEVNIPDVGLAKVHYTINSDLQNQADQLLKSYKPDYGAIVMMDAETGKILALSSFVKNNSMSNLTLKATFPAASTFKVITAATAIDRKGITVDHQIAFNGGNYTLYKKNVLSEKITKWTRFISFKDAFARSINTAFGRLALENLDPHDLDEYARRFMFNKKIPSDLNVEMSQVTIPDEKGFELTQVASGYNRFNTMSPIHGAMIAGAVINDGKIVTPYIVDSLEQNNKEVYKGQPLEIGQAITPESAQELQKMMEQTVLAGTSRKSFRKLLKDKKFSDVEMGGKTGHFSGENPRGRNDWFIGYATDGDSKIAIAAITVNVQRWTVKSSALAEMMFRKHFKTIQEDKAYNNRIPKKLNLRSQGNGQTHVADLKSDKT